MSYRVSCGDCSIYLPKVRTRPFKVPAYATAATLPFVGRACVDHKGRSFETMQAMCLANGVSTSCYCNRRKKGFDVEQSLTILGVFDHLNIEYKNTTEMRVAYGISETVFTKRKRAGWDLEKILTTPVIAGNCKQITYADVMYSSLAEFCRHLDLDYPVFLGLYRTDLELAIAKAIKNTG